MLLGIVVIVVIFAIATARGMTDPHQFGSHKAQEGLAAGAEHAAEHDSGGHDGQPAGHGETAAADHHPHMYAVFPFVLLLGAIAILPLLRLTEHWWESNRNRFVVAAALGLVTLTYYLGLYPHGGWDKVVRVLDHAVLQEYIPFIVLLFSLYTISGGIRIAGDLPARPLTNTLILGLGGLLASFIGTTGAAMLLIRPLLETNKERRFQQHTVVFFIFVVCNCGGCLLPIGDPPLFLGYLMGIEFLWTMWNLWAPWLAVNLLLLAIYYLWDRLFCYPRERRDDIRLDEVAVRPLRITGLWPNLFLLAGVVAAIALLAPDPERPFPGTNWVPYVFLREVVQLGLVALSLLLGSRAVRVANQFNYHAIVEVAALFIGIFVCMQPAIEILDVRGKSLGIDTPSKAFWATGGLSAMLDNAPTYVVFFKTAESQFPVFFPQANPRVDGDSFAEGVSLTGAECGGHDPRRRHGSCGEGPRQEPGRGGHARCDQPGSRVPGSHDLHRKRPELHGASHCRASGRQDAQLFRIRRPIQRTRVDSPVRHRYLGFPGLVGTCATRSLRKGNHPCKGRLTRSQRRRRAPVRAAVRDACRR